jgi:hypothetical protein
MAGRGRCVRAAVNEPRGRLGRTADGLLRVVLVLLRPVLDTLQDVFACWRRIKVLLPQLGTDGEGPTYCGLTFPLDPSGSGGSPLKKKKKKN